MVPTAEASIELPVPDFYEPRNAAIWSHRPDPSALYERAAAWRQEFDLSPARDDEPVVRLLLVDLQKDFCLPSGSLYVAGRSGRGATDDTDRIARFIYRNLGRLTEIICTLDTHHPFQIFFPAFWRRSDGEPVEPHTEVRADDVRSGRLQPDSALAAWLADGDQEWLRRQALFYCEELERAGKYGLYLWPPHCLLGSAGHELVGVIQEARLFHAFARKANNPVEIKGEHPLTEHYSALSPEVPLRHDGGRLVAPDRTVVDRLLSSDVLLIAGQAASHCVKHTVDDLLAETEQQAGRTARIFLLEDCMSAVVVRNPEGDEPLVDFTPEVADALGRYRAAGVSVVRSTTPVSGWSGFPALGAKVAQ